MVHALARELERLGHRVRVFAPHPVKGAAPEHLVIDGVPVVRSRSVPVPLYPEYRWAVFPFRQLRGEGLGDEVDVIHLHTPGMMGSAAFLAARRFAKPLVGTFHTNVWAMRGSFPATPLVRTFFRAARWYTLGTYFRCDLTTAPTAAAREALLAGARKPFRRPVEVVPNGIPLDRFHPGVARPDWRGRCGLPDGPLVTYLGRLTVDKGVHRFLDAVEALTPRADFSAIVAGTGPEEPAVRERLARDPRLGRSVRYVGGVAEEEKAALLAQSDLFVLPSTSDTSSVALLEAMASGAACVAPNTGGPADLIDDGVNGRRTDVTAPGALAGAIGGLLDRPAERRRLADGGVEYVRRHASIEVTARRFISLYELLLSERHGGSVVA